MIQTFATTPRVAQPQFGTVLAEREPKIAPTLSISVIIAWVNALDLVCNTLNALQSQTRLADEIIVVTRHDNALQEKLRAQFPHVVLIATPRDTPITKLRSIGIQHAHGEILAFTEDHCSPSPQWIEIIRERMSKTSCAAVGGVVENARTKRLRDWAAFLTEYAGAVRSDADENAPQGLPGNNVAYRRSVIQGLRETFDSGRWESFYNQALERDNAALYFEPNLLVMHDRPFDFFYFVQQRFVFSRSFAGMRNQSFTKMQRVKYGLACAVLPPMLMLRGFTTLYKKKRFVAQYLKCLPLITVYVTAGAVGEGVGYFFGGGESLSKVE